MGREDLLRLGAGSPELAQQVTEAIRKLDRDHEEERERMLAVFEEAPAFMVVYTGPELRMTRMNRRARELVPGMIGKPLREVYPDNDIVATVERVYTTGVAESIANRPLSLIETSYVGRYFTRAYIPLRDAHGQ